jgi:hypothetical protein
MTRPRASLTCKESACACRGGVLPLRVVSFGRRYAVVLALTASWLASSVPAHAAETRYFSYEDDRYLLPGQHRGGAVLLTDDVDAETTVPLVVFLHGTNSAGEPHLWLGGGGRDLRPLATRLMFEGKVHPFVLAGPSQTKGAAGARTLWSELDLPAFVDSVALASHDRVQIDRQRVVVAGHSGAGCNPTGGLATDFWSHGRVEPWALVSIDSCLDAEMGGALGGTRPATIALSVWWQSAIWQRAPVDFWTALTADKPEQRVDRMVELPAIGPNPHEAIVPIAFERTLLELFGAAAKGE